MTLRTGDHNQPRPSTATRTSRTCKDEIAQGCQPFYTPNTGTACPATRPRYGPAPSRGSASRLDAARRPTRSRRASTRGSSAPTRRRRCTQSQSYASELVNGWDRSDPRIVQLLLVAVRQLQRDAATATGAGHRLRDLLHHRLGGPGQRLQQPLPGAPTTTRRRQGQHRRALHPYVQTRRDAVGVALRRRMPSPHASAY